jgi:hypothetical protein
MKNQTSYHLPTMLCLALLVALVAFWQGSPAAAESSTVVGMAAQGVNAVEYIGEIQQTGRDFTTYGYLTYVKGLSPANLYTDPNNPSASTARFTFSGSAILTSRAQVRPPLPLVTQLSAVGPLTIYFNANGANADFSDPSSFAQGKEIATFDTRVLSTLAVTAANLGVFSAISDAKQQSAQQFMLNGKRLQFGHPNLMQRANLGGRGDRTDPVAPDSIVRFAAYGVTP